MNTGTHRPLISLNDKNQITHNGTPCRVVMTKELIRVGCTDVSPAAAEFILKAHKQAFNNNGVVVLQDTETPPAT